MVDEVSAEEYEEVRDSVCMEIANTVIGNVLVNPNGKALLDISPPELIFDKNIEVTNKEVKQTYVESKFGKIKVITIGDRELC